ncbi:MAG: T9SS type A sorting domain-containing protein [Ignavibacteriales bacterium]|nr:MAG: T9SS type A sorting domain-containing protein [Ignavibacteriales bacterium]
MYHLLVLLIFAALSIFDHTLAQPEAFSNRITIVFPYFEPVNPAIVTSGNWDFTPMTKLSSNTYSFEAQQLNVGEPFMFYARYTLPPFNSGQPYYVSTKEAGLSRIIYAKVYVNDVLLSNSFVQSDGNIHYKFSSNGSIMPVDDTGQSIVNDRIPPEVHWPFYKIHYPNNPSHSNPDINQVVAWATVITDNNYDMPVKVEIDYLRLYARTASGDILLTTDEYISGFNQTSDGGLYWRYPFFPPEFDQHTPMPAINENEALVFYPNQHRDTVWHFWNSQWPRAVTSPQHTSYFAQISYRITGKAAIQIGIDFYGGSEGNTYRVLEAGVSDWGFETYTNAWKTITFDTKPAVTSLEGNDIKINDKKFEMLQSFPNPFNPRTTIELRLPQSGKLVVIIYNLKGERVAELFNSEVKGDNVILKFSGKSFASGVYFVRATFGESVITQRLLLMK